MKRRLFWILAIIIFLVLVGGGVYLYLKGKISASADIAAGGKTPTKGSSIFVSLPSEVSVRQAGQEVSAETSGKAISSYFKSNPLGGTPPAGPQGERKIDRIIGLTQNGKPILPDLERTGEIQARAETRISLNWDDQSFINLGYSLDELNQLKGFQEKVFQFLREKLTLFPFYPTTVTVTADIRKLVPGNTAEDEQVRGDLSNNAGGVYFYPSNVLWLNTFTLNNRPIISAHDFIHEFIHAYYDDALAFLEPTAAEGTAEGIAQVVSQAVLDNPSNFSTSQGSLIYQDLADFFRQNQTLAYDNLAGPELQGPINYDSWMDLWFRYQVAAQSLNKVYYNNPLNFYNQFNVNLKAEIDMTTGRLYGLRNLVLNSPDAQRAHDATAFDVVFGGIGTARKDSVLYKGATAGVNPARIKIEGSEVASWIGRQPAFSPSYRPGNYFLQFPGTNKILAFRRGQDGVAQPITGNSFTFAPSSSIAQTSLASCNGQWGNNSARTDNIGVADFPATPAGFSNGTLVYRGVLPFTTTTGASFVRVVEIRKSGTRCNIGWNPQAAPVAFYKATLGSQASAQRSGKVTFSSSQGEGGSFTVENGAIFGTNVPDLKVGRTYKVYFSPKDSRGRIGRPLSPWIRTNPTESDVFRASFPFFCPRIQSFGRPSGC